MPPKHPWECDDEDVAGPVAGSSGSAAASGTAHPWEQASSDGDYDSSSDVDVVGAADEFISFCRDLFCRTLSAKQFCTLMRLAGEAGIEE